MAILVRIPTPLQKLTDGKAEVACTAATILELVDALEKDYPGMKERLSDGGQKSRVPHGEQRVDLLRVAGGLQVLRPAEVLKLDQRPPYWEDPESLRTLTRIGQFTVIAPTINDAASRLLKSKGVDLSVDAQLGKSYAKAVAPLLDSLFVKQTDTDP
jgi:molybdopterin converting factor small subunit